MKSRKTTTLGIYLSGLLGALVLSACASQVVSSTPEESVRQRAVQRADAFVKGDFAGSYALTAPSYRKLRSLEAYKSGFGQGGVWQKAEIKGVACEPARCKVSVAASVKPLIRGRFGDTIDVQFEEIWLLEDGNWWLHQGL